MKSDRYEPKACEICGRMFKPGRKGQWSCGAPECIKALRLQNSINWQRKHYAAKKESRRKAQEPKPDTIIAIGYADRQRAETLKLAGRVNTEL